MFNITKALIEDCVETVGAIEALFEHSEVSEISWNIEEDRISSVTLVLEDGRCVVLSGESLEVRVN